MYYDNIKPINDTYMPFLEPIRAAEQQLNNYTEIIIEGSVNINNSISLGSMILEAIKDHFAIQF
jgi:hypothetical protein